MAVDTMYRSELGLGGDLFYKKEVVGCCVLVGNHLVLVWHLTNKIRFCIKNLDLGSEPAEQLFHEFKLVHIRQGDNDN